MPNDKLDEVLKVVGLLAHRSSGGDYIFRGEPECYERVFLKPLSALPEY